MDAFPDGGLSRVRMIGSIDAEARRRAGLRWFNSLPGNQAIHCLQMSGVSDFDAAKVAAARPFDDDWERQLQSAGVELDLSPLKQMLDGPD